MILQIMIQVLLSLQRLINQQVVRERVLLQTTIVPIYCIDGSVMLDSASQCTFMTDRIAKLLKLSSQRKETLSLCTFGYQGPHSIDTYVSIIAKDGSQLDLQANVLKQITSPIQKTTSTT